ncbi:MAG: hypothetical protein HY907_09945 [Deltaproteobacteria bacterium]|nr:hypothetical protein [Deltaproteobacteria bacterium]
MWKIAWIMVVFVQLAACSGRGGPRPPGGTADRATAESPASGTRWEDGYLLAPDSPDPLACATEADCTCAMLVAEDGCCQPSIWPAPQTRVYQEWLRRHLESEACRDVECPLGPPPAPPLPCQSKARCFDGYCSTACAQMPGNARGVSPSGFGGCPQDTSCPENAAPVPVALEVARIEIVPEEHGLQVRCQATLRSLASGPITVRTNFASVFDGVSVVLSGPDGAELKRQAYIHHQSPYSSDGVPVELAVGETTQELVFPLFDFTTELPVVRVRLEGDLPRVPGSAGLRSEELDVTVGAGTAAVP